jgi:methylated-DNA-[protein]-cysteine S-methyltransferase
MTDHWGLFETKFGRCAAWVDDKGRLVRFHANPKRPERIDPEAVRDDNAVSAVKTQVLEYCEGRRKSFDIPLAPRGSDFQQAVWKALREIPYGETTTYGALAKKLGQPTGARAVGLANGQNPIWLIVPCHRVIGADGRLTGYAGGLPLKKALLEHEGALSDLFAKGA